MNKNNLYLVNSIYTQVEHVETVQTLQCIYFLCVVLLHLSVLVDMSILSNVIHVLVICTFKNLFIAYEIQFYADHMTNYHCSIKTVSDLVHFVMHCNLTACFGFCYKRNILYVW